MAENIQETKPPEPPPRPPEVPKPTEQPDRSDGPASFAESQQSAQQDTRNAASSEHAKATRGPEPEGLRPTPEFQSRLNEHSATKNGPEGLQPTPEVQERLDAHTAAKAGPFQDSSATQPPQDVGGVPHQRSQDSAAQEAPGNQTAASPVGEQAGEHVATRETAAAERTKATEGTTTPQDSAPVQDPGDAQRPPAPGDPPQDGSTVVPIGDQRPTAPVSDGDVHPPAVDTTVPNETPRLVQPVQEVAPQPDPLADSLPVAPDPLTTTPDLFPAGEPLPAGPELFPAGPDPLSAGPDVLPAGPDGFPAGPDGFPAGPDGFPAGPDSLDASLSGESSTAVDENGPPLPAVEQTAEREPDTTGQQDAAAAQPGNQNAEQQAGHAPEKTSAGDGATDAAQRDSPRIPTDIAQEIASSPVDVKTKPHVNSVGDTVDRYMVDDVDDLLPLAEHLGLNELEPEEEGDYYAGQLPDGRYRKMEWNMEGHPHTNEGPHVKVMETVDPWSAPAKGGNRWKTVAVVFVEGHEQFKKQWR